MNNQPAQPAQPAVPPALVSTPAAGTVFWREGHDTDLHDLVVNARRLLVLVGRSASSSRHAAKDVHKAADSLASRFGLDATAAVPDVERLMDLIGSHGRYLEPGGRRGRNRFLLVDLTGAGIVVCLSVGVASPGAPGHADALADHFKNAASPPAGVYANATHRFSRSAHGHTKLYNELDRLHRSVGAWAGDGAIGRWNLDNPHASPTLGILCAARAVELKTMAGRRKLAE